MQFRKARLMAIPLLFEHGGLLRGSRSHPRLPFITWGAIVVAAYSMLSVSAKVAVSINADKPPPKTARGNCRRAGPNERIKHDIAGETKLGDPSESVSRS